MINGATLKTEKWSTVPDWILRNNQRCKIVHRWLFLSFQSGTVDRFSVINLEPLIVSQFSMWNRWSFLSHEKHEVLSFRGYFEGDRGWKWIFKVDIHNQWVILTWFNSADFGKVELQILAELNFTILWLLTLAQLNFWAFLSRVLQYRYESIPLVQLGRPLVQLCHLKVNLNYCSLTSTIYLQNTWYFCLFSSAVYWRLLHNWNTFKKVYLQFLMYLQSFIKDKGLNFENGWKSIPSRAGIFKQILYVPYWVSIPTISNF